MSTPNRNQILDLLTALLPVQLQEVAYRYGFNQNHIAPAAAPLEIAIALAKDAERKQDLAGLAEIIKHSTGEQIDKLSEQVKAEQGSKVSPGLSRSLHSEAEREQVRALLQQYRKLVPEQQAQLPQALEKLAKLELAAGDFAAAVELFGEQAAQARDKQEKATAFYNQHRACLENKDFEDALKHLLQAAKLLPAEFEPFPLRRYRPEKILGAGGFGTVFLCKDAYSGDEQVVIKALQGEQLARSVNEIFHEAHLLRRLNHRSIIRAFHWDFADPAKHVRPYLVLEYFPGQSLQSYIEEHGPVSLDEATRLAQLLAEPLIAAHARDVLHRDLKPANILVRKTEQDWELKLIDFGLGLRLNKQAGGGNTILGRSMTGSLHYAPPEQIGGTFYPCGTYSDVFSFGRSLCFALHQTPTPSNRNWKNLGEHVLVDLLDDCVEPEPEKRPQSLSEAMRFFEPQTASVVEVKSTLQSMQIKPALPKPESKAKQSWTDPGTGIEFIKIPAGSFLMGSPKNEAGRYDAEGPQHKVWLDEFWLAKTLVTQAQWQALMSNNPSHFKAYFKSEDRPVEQVSWDDAQVFIEKFNQQSSRAARLPTEAEWEYAARAGTTTAFYTGHCISTEQANYNGKAPYADCPKDQYRQETTPVGSFPPNPFGLYDMHGNAFEWVADWYGAYSEAEQYNPSGPDSGTYHVLRGSSWFDDARYLRSAFRHRCTPDYQSQYIGFRLALVLSETDVGATLAVALA